MKYMPRHGSEKKMLPTHMQKKLPSCSATVVEEERGSVQLRRGIECHVADVAFMGHGPFSPMAHVTIQRW